MINLGIIFPKFKKNSLVGLRTKQSLKSNEAWALNQNYGGKILIIFGLVIVVGNLFLQKTYGFYFFIICFILIIPITLLLTIKKGL